MCMSVMAMQEPAWAALAWLGLDITTGVVIVSVHGVVVSCIRVIVFLSFFQYNVGVNMGARIDGMRMEGEGCVGEELYLELASSVS